MRLTDMGDPKPSHMYILRCADDTLYVGSTTDLGIRVWQHNEGLGSAYTRRRRPVTLAYAEEFPSVEEAYRREKQVQGWSRAKRDALIEGRTDELRSNMPTYWKRQREIERRERARRRSASETG